MQRVGVEEFLRGAAQHELIDVRSPAEYARGHIPGAVNIPLFDDQERARVGTVYKQRSRQQAIDLGLELVGPKLRPLADQARQVAAGRPLQVYCWRGGMRSEKMAWLFETAGLQTAVLQGGYKAYRQYLHDFFAALTNLIVLQGPTGSGKTEILQALADMGEQVLDLEGLAHHRGSAFGGLGMPPQPTTQQFQNDLLQAVRTFDKQQPVWVESESLTIGKVYLPESLWQNMNRAPVVAVTLPMEERIKNIIRRYGHFPVAELSERIARLRQRMGGQHVQEAIGLLGKGDLPAAVRLLLHYYDKAYAHSARTYKAGRVTEVNLQGNNPAEHARQVLVAVKNIVL